MAKSVKFYTNLKSNLEQVRVRYTSLWSLIAQITGTGETYGQELGEIKYDESQTLDRMAYDPMCKRAIETISDYYASLVFPTNNPFSIVPNIDENEVRAADSDWFEKQSDKIIKALYSG